MRKTPLQRHLTRAGLIAAMLGGGLLYAGIGQAQDIGVQDVRAERAAELAAATGGPAASEHLIPYASDKAAVDERDDDVAPITPEAAPLVNATPKTPGSEATGPVTPGRIASAEVSPSAPR